MFVLGFECSVYDMMRDIETNLIDPYNCFLDSLSFPFLRRVKPFHSSYVQKNMEPSTSIGCSKSHTNLLTINRIPKNGNIFKTKLLHWLNTNRNPPIKTMPYNVHGRAELPTIADITIECIGKIEQQQTVLQP